MRICYALWYYLREYYTIPICSPYIQKLKHTYMEKCYQKAKVLLMLVMSITIIASFFSPIYSGYAITENKTIMQSQEIPDITKN